jgi:hypothetical protein
MMHGQKNIKLCLFNIFAATLHIGGRSPTRNLRTRHAVVTGPTCHTWAEQYKIHESNYAQMN